MQRISRAPVLSATRSRGLLLDHFATSRISARRQFFVFDSGRVSTMRTTSPTLRPVLLVVRVELRRAADDLLVPLVRLHGVDLDDDRLVHRARDDDAAALLAAAALVLGLRERGRSACARRASRASASSACGARGAGCACASASGRLRRGGFARRRGAAAPRRRRSSASAAGSSAGASSAGASSAAAPRRQAPRAASAAGSSARALRRQALLEPRGASSARAPRRRGSSAGSLLGRGAPRRRGSSATSASGALGLGCCVFVLVSVLSSAISLCRPVLASRSWRTVRMRAISRLASFRRAVFSSAPVADWKRRLNSSCRVSASASRELVVGHVAQVSSSQRDPPPASRTSS